MLPSEVKIGAHMFQVVEKGTAITDDCGILDLPSLTISIRRDMPDSNKWETLVHEVVHAIRKLSGTELADEEQEENVVQSNAHLLFLFLKDNPTLLDELKASHEIQII